jgi:hypothetical protein
MQAAIKALKGGGLLLIAGILAWRVLVTGLANYYAGQDTPEADAGTLRWRSDQPAALVRQGRALIEREPSKAESLLQAAAWANPTDAMVYLALAELWQRSGFTEKATGLMTIADLLGPMRPPVLARSAAFWVQQNRLDLTLARWSALLRNRPENATLVYPVFLQLAENPLTQPFLQPFLAQPPEWWDEFFAYAARTAVQTETVAFLYQHRNRDGALPTVAEQQAYLGRLWKEERWLEAYLTWLSGLDESQQSGLGNLYNGNFELPITNAGFDWRAASPRGATVETIETYSTRGGKSLHVNFNGERVHFQHLYQYLYLESGRYQFQGRARVDSLHAERGLRWRLHCANARIPLLAESEPFVGSDDWRSFAVNFTVPKQDCPLQLLRLELDGRVELEFEARGDAWFDELSISRQE